MGGLHGNWRIYWVSFCKYSFIQGGKNIYMQPRVVCHINGSRRGFPRYLQWSDTTNSQRCLGHSPYLPPNYCHFNLLITRPKNKYAFFFFQLIHQHTAPRFFFYFIFIYRGKHEPPPFFLSFPAHTKLTLGGKKFLMCLKHNCLL